MILERGALLNNRYKIVEILGQGGMGSVYRAVDENLGVEVAVKDNLFTTEEYARQFRREAVILANLRHPNLPRVTDHFVIENQGQYLVMDYIEGEDLRQRMDRVGLLSDEEVVTIGAAICDALTYLSTRSPSIIHRDIKPGNVKITPQGQIFLVDFGLAKVVQGTQATTTGARAMTPGYSPPEQYGTARTDNRSDIFSLGATLYAALTGTIPEDALARAMEQSELTSIRKINPRVSRRLTGVIEKSLKVQPDERYQSAEEFKQALLSSRTSPRRNTGGEYIVTPPPEGAVNANGSIDPLSPLLVEDQPIRSPTRSEGMPIFVSAPLDELALERIPSRPRKRSKLRGCVWVAVIAIFLVVISMAAAYYFDPNLPTRTLASVWPSNLGLPVVVVSPSFTPTSTPSQSPPTPTSNMTEPVVLALASATPTEQVVLPTDTETPVPTDTPTPQPTASGGGAGQLAFASDASGTVQVYIVNFDGSDIHQITDMPEGACQPKWSPDGQRLVFISPCNSNQDTYQQSAMFIVNADGSGLVPLPTVPGGDFDPAWSPDGKRIAFSSLRVTGRPRIYVLNLEDNSVVRLSDEYSRDLQPAWSPDGSQIAFITTRRGPAQVWIMDPDGQNQHLFSHSRDLIDANPAWSPDGEIILFTQYVERTGGFPKLVVAPVQDDGMREFVINEGPIPMREGHYSPDGVWIAFESWPKGSNHDIYIITANGVGRRQLTTGARNEFDVDWRPATP
jgi:serine/threonine protein kinase/Tol biopolymer transport system component